MGCVSGTAVRLLEEGAFKGGSGMTVVDSSLQEELAGFCFVVVFFLSMVG